MTTQSLVSETYGTNASGRVIGRNKVGVFTMLKPRIQWSKFEDLIDFIE